MIDYQVIDQVAILTWNMKDHAVNVVNEDSLARFSLLIEQAIADDHVKGIVIASAKRDYIVGADLASFLDDRSPKVIFDKARITQAVLRRLESAGKPVCAAINGSAIGGGLEIALACHHRLVADKASLQLGLPEATLGLLPGAGGTQRLPRLLGIQASLPLLLEGKLLNPTEARKIGLVDAIVREEDSLIDSASAWVRQQHVPMVQPWDVKGFKLPGGELGPVALYGIFANETAKITARTHNNLPALKHILAAVFEGCQSDFDTGLKAEARHFVSCVCSSVSGNIIRTSLLGISNARELKYRPPAVPLLRFNVVGVVGASEAACEIVIAAARAELAVLWLSDPSGHRPVDPAILKLDTESANRIVVAASVRELASSQFLIESCEFDQTEYADFRVLIQEQLPTGVSMVAVHVCGRPPHRHGVSLHMLGLPFKDQLIEILRGVGTSDVEQAHAMDFAKRLGKIPLVVDGTKGSYVQRVRQAYIDEAYTMQKEGIAPTLINNVARQSGMATSPISIEHRNNETACGTINSRTPTDWIQVQAVCNIVKQRLLNIQAIEALRCVEQGVVASPLDADIGASIGWEFPQHHGGPFGMIDAIGAWTFIKQCRSLSEGYGKRFEPPQIVLTKATRGEMFHAI